MRLSELRYELPPELIATEPCAPRDAARLLVLDRASGALAHRAFRDLPEYLRPGDCLVVNDTRVLPARLFLRRESGGRVEGLFLRETLPSAAAAANQWQILLKPAGRLRAGELLAITDESGAAVEPPAALRLVAPQDRGAWIVEPTPPLPAAALLARVGRTPLPPYILRARQARPASPANDADVYQTVYAKSAGAVAAPTAGLHFTPRLLDALTDRGVQRAAVTLHVGPGTFQPVEVEDLSRHVLHAEWFEVRASALETIASARAAGGRIVAVGTTSARVLETLAARDTPPCECSGWTDLFIRPPHRFRGVDALITNFHLPESTLLALVMAFASPPQIQAAYAAAIAARYRFYSFGDAMLII